jgi:hypothetical protein
MKNKTCKILIGILFLLVFPMISATQTCQVYDDFSSEVLNVSKWEIRPNNQNWPLTDEYFIENGVYHMAQLNTRPAATGLEIINRIFYPGDVVEYDVNYVSGSGNRVHTISLNGLSHQWALIGFWNTLADGGVGNDLGMWHVKITFIEDGVITEMTKPDGTRGTSIYCPTGFCYLNSPGLEHTLGIMTGLGHNGLVHMDYDNVIICTEDTEEPEPPLEERIVELEEKVEELEDRTTWLESIIDKIITFIKNLPKGLSKIWVD